MIFGLNIWQSLLLLIAFEMIVAPFIVGTVNSIINGYFKAKDAHIGRIAKAISDALTSSLEFAAKTLEEQIKKAKEQNKI